MTLRTHQTDFDRTISAILAGSPIRDIVAHVTPGGGKSTLPIQAGRLITAGLADRICWICPRASLQDQAERNFIDPFFRRMFNHNLVIRQATNDHNPSRGTNGWVSTYQALAVDWDGRATQDFDRYNYILILDEFHHLAADGEWTEPIRELYDRAAYRVLMTGTLARGDEKRIAFVPYRQATEATATPYFERQINTALITYTRRDALADRAIIPLEFHFADGVAEWVKECGAHRRDKLSTGRGDANQALFTALKTEYAEELLVSGIDHWQRWRKDVNPNSTVLVVAANIETAKEYTSHLKRRGLHAEIATSDDTPQAVKNINALKGGKLKILVSVAMCSEGLDVPSVDHEIALTNIRSEPWIIQMTARANRIDPQAGPYSSQKGHIFAPADRMFTELARKIEGDQCEAVARTKAPGEIRTGGEGNGNGGRPGITPLSSKMLGREHETLSLFGETNSPFRETMVPVYEKTQREIETDLREEIDTHVRAWSRAFGYLPAALNRKIVVRFGKRREAMSVKELEAVRGWLGAEYPKPESKPPGIVLEAVPWR